MNEIVFFILVFIVGIVIDNLNFRLLEFMAKFPAYIILRFCVQVSHMYVIQQSLGNHLLCFVF